MEIEILEDGKEAASPPLPTVAVESDRDMVTNMKQALVNKGITGDFLAGKIARMMDAKTRTQSGHEIDDNSIQFKAIELALKLGGIKGIGNAPVVAIFNNAPAKDEKLKY